ncbi:MAG: hypothetical protein R3B55_02340 [Candidatus Paceibacterota bacterium]
MNEKFYIFLGVNHEDKGILERFDYPGKRSIVFRVTGTSQLALPSEKEMDKISSAYPCIVFPVNVKMGLGGTQNTVDLKEYMLGRMASIIYVDPDTKLYWAANEIDMRSEKFVEICVNGTELIHVKYFVPDVVSV